MWIAKIDVMVEYPKPNEIGWGTADITIRASDENREIARGKLGDKVARIVRESDDLLMDQDMPKDWRVISIYFDTLKVERFPS